MNLSILWLSASLAIAGCDPPPRPDVAPAPDAEVAPDQPRGVAEKPLARATAVGRLIVRIDANIAFRKKQGAKRKGWIHYEALAAAYLSRARLAGNLDDYVAAGVALQEAFEVAKPGAGPFFARAHYNFTIHRIFDVEADLVADEKTLLRKKADVERTAGLRGDVALHMGDLDEARRHYLRARTARNSLATVARLAYLFLKTGNYKEARAGYDAAITLAKSDKGQRAWAMLQRGLVELEQGYVQEALKWYEQADALFSGWYLIEEHIAEAKLLLGDVDDAIERYESIVARTPNGEFMAKLAECYGSKGDAENQRLWQGRAREAFERDVAKLPSAASGHALQFYLIDNPERALELALMNLDLRPSHDARMWLAQAYLATAEAAKARLVLEPVLGSQWVAPEFVATVVLAFEGAPKQPEIVADPADVAALRKRLRLAE